MNRDSKLELRQDLKPLTDILVKNYLGYTAGSFLIIADDLTLDIADSVINSVESILQSNNVDSKCISKIDSNISSCIELLNLDIYRRRGSLVYISNSLERALLSTLTNKNISYNTTLYLATSSTEERPIINRVLDLGLARGKFGGLPSCRIEVLTAAYHPSNDSTFSQLLYKFLLQEKEVQITCDRGTNLNVSLNHDLYSTINSSGILIPQRYGNPIPAEVFAHPESVRGRLVISGSYSALLKSDKYAGKFSELYRDLTVDPIIMDIENGEVISVYCNNSYIDRFVKKEVFEVDPVNGKKIGEFGLPANLHVLSNEITGSFIIDEKGRVHIAHGHGYPTRTGCKYDSPIHNDGLIANASLYSKRLGKYFLKNNAYDFDVLKL